jgi:WD40 repeat protein
VATVAEDGQLLFWDVNRSGEPTPEGSTGVVSAPISAAALTDGTGALAQRWGGLSLWRRGQAVPVQIPGAEVVDVVFSDDRKTIAWIQEQASGPTIVAQRLANLGAPLAVNAWAGASGASVSPRALALDGKGGRLAVLLQAEVRVVDVAGGARSPVSVRSGAGVTALAFVDQDTLALGRDDGRVQLWPIAGSVEASVISRHPRGVAVKALAVAARKEVASLGQDGSLRIFAPGAPSRTRVARLAAPLGGPLSLAFSPRGGMVVASSNTEIGVFSLEGEEGEVGRFHHERDLRAVAFAGDGAEAVLGLDVSGAVHRWAIGVHALAADLRQRPAVQCTTAQER